MCCWESDGTFLAAQNFAAGSKPMFVATGDFNRDSKIDWPQPTTAQHRQHPVEQRRRHVQGSGTVTVGAESDSVINDFNRDSKLGWPSPMKGDSASNIVLGSGDGTFQGQQTFAAAVAVLIGARPT